MAMVILDLATDLFLDKSSRLAAMLVLVMLRFLVEFGRVVGLAGVLVGVKVGLIVMMSRAAIGAGAGLGGKGGVISSRIEDVCNSTSVQASDDCLTLNILNL